MGAHHPPELVRLAVEAERATLDLLVVLELELEELHHLDRRPSGPGDAHGGVVVGGEHLLDPTVADEVAGGGTPVAGHEHAAVVAHRDHGGAVRDVDAARERHARDRSSEAGILYERGEVRSGVALGWVQRQRHERRG